MIQSLRAPVYSNTGKLNQLQQILPPIFANYILPLATKEDATNNNKLSLRLMINARNEELAVNIREVHNFHHFLKFYL